MKEDLTIKDPDRINFLIEESIKGRPAAQYKLYKQYSRAMFNIAYRIANNREDAEDILQESFIECFRNLKSFRAESTFGAWLKSIVINKSIDHLRKKDIQLILQENLPDVPEEEEKEEENGETTLKISNIIHCMGLLPAGYRVVLSLYLLEGYDHSEISQILGISESTSKSQYSRARAKLKKLLKKFRNGLT